MNNFWIELLVIGLIVGLMLGGILRNKGFGFLGNLVAGLVGAILGSFLYEKLLNRYLQFDLAQITINLNKVAIALLGAFLFVLILSFLKKKEH